MAEFDRYCENIHLCLIVVVQLFIGVSLRVGVLVVDALLELALFGVDGGHCLVVIENFLSLEMLVVDFLMEDSSFEFPLGFVKCIDDDS